MKILAKLTIAVVTIFVLLQFLRPSLPFGPTTTEIQAPPQVLHVLQKDCYSCHSNEKHLSWFDQIVPGYWLVRHDILTAREHLNFSEIGSKPEAAQRAGLFEAVNMIQLGAMPLPKFTALHPDAKVSSEELATLKLYLAPWGSTPPNATGVSGDDRPTAGFVNLTAVAPEFNGLAFDPGFETWKVISFTDRGDNNTFRFILGNDVAVKAARAGNIAPWPDGSRFAKIAWQQVTGNDGLIHPGKFVQVEIMVKNGRLYKHTAGWGWGRWRGMDLKPYGADARFVNECTSCHMPVRGADDVFTLPISAAKTNAEEVLNNQAAALPPGLPYQPLEWSAITMYVDRHSHTLSTLFGNDEAMLAIPSHQVGSNATVAYQVGAVLALVTWTERDDPHWFGARIPMTPRSIEFVRIEPQGTANTYQYFSGTETHPQPIDVQVASQRKSFVLNLTPAALP